MTSVIRSRTLRRDDAPRGSARPGRRRRCRTRLGPPPEGLAGADREGAEPLQLAQVGGRLVVAPAGLAVRARPPRSPRPSRAPPAAGGGWRGRASGRRGSRSGSACSARAGPRRSRSRAHAQSRSPTRRWWRNGQVEERRRLPAADDRRQLVEAVPAEPLLERRDRLEARPAVRASRAPDGRCASRTARATRRVRARRRSRSRSRASGSASKWPEQALEEVGLEGDVGVEVHDRRRARP